VAVVKFSAVRVLVSSVLCLLGGCASLREAEARDDVRDAKVAGWVYRQPCSEVVRATRELLFAKDFQVTAPADALEFETSWRLKRGAQMHAGTRFLISATVVESGGCRLEATRQQLNQSGGSEGGERDLDLEWEVLRRVDPEAAKAR